MTEQQARNQVSAHYLRLAVEVMQDSTDPNDWILSEKLLIEAEARHPKERV